MANVQRVNGNANGIVNYDISLSGVSSVGKIISNGIGRHPTCYKIVAPATLVGEMGVEGKVELAIRTIQIAASTLAYQVDAAQLSVMVDATGWLDADLETALVAVLGAGTTCVSTGGFKLA